MALPGRMLESGVKSGTNLSRAVLDGIFALGNEMKVIFTEALKKEPVENMK